MGEFKGDIGDVWHMFFTQARACGVKAVEQGVISVADVEEQEPYLFLGLPGLTLLELALRSLDAETDTLVLACGAVLSRRSLPEGAGSTELFVALIHATHELREVAFSDEDVSHLRQAVLRAEGACSPEGNP